LGEQLTIKGQLTRAILVRHFQAQSRAAIIGLHSGGSDNLGKWGALDIDYHGPTSTSPDVNLRAALRWYGALIRLGFHPLLTDSNGRGGFHLRILLAEQVLADRLFRFLKSLTADHRQLGFPKPPEQFPKQPDVRRCAKGLGNWLRVPGRHHKREHWSRVWDGGRWQTGAEAVDYILTQTGDRSSLLPLLPEPEPPRRPHAGRSAAPSGLAARIATYMSRLPNLGEGQGRDDIAFRFAAFLSRDLALGDDVALAWLCRWDAGNRPPKGRDRLAEILRNSRQYGQRPVGCGLNRESSLQHDDHATDQLRTEVW
jgi:hypothetical protein